MTMPVSRGIMRTSKLSMVLTWSTEGKDSTEEETLALQDEKHYQEVRAKIFESLQLIEDYEESYKIFMAAKPDPVLEKKREKFQGSSCKAAEAG